MWVRGEDCIKDKITGVYSASVVKENGNEQKAKFKNRTLKTNTKPKDKRTKKVKETKCST